MPPPRQRERDNSRRKSSRSMSPPAQRHKRTWQSSSHDRSHFNRSPPPKKKHFKSPPRFRQSSGAGFGRKSRSHSPKLQKRNVGNLEGQRYLPKENLKSRSPNRGEKAEFGSRLEPRPKKRSLSPRISSNTYRVQEQDERKLKNASRSPESTRYHDYPSKKKSRQSTPPPVHKKLSRGRSSSPSQSSAKKPESSHRNSEREGSIPQRKVSNESKKKTSHGTLHKRFTTDETGPFQLNMRDNVTIAILRNPHAEPSEDVTVQRIFDSSMFKMVHRKTEGRRPIFDREEIKVWRHDENLDDDPDFEERRLVRVKAIPKKAADSLMRMSPDVLRKSFGFDFDERPRSRSPNVRLNPQPDSRYESRYQQQINRDEMDSHKRKKDDDRRGSGSRGGRGDEEEDRFQGRGEDRSVREDRYSKGDDYDLRQALERRRSGKDEDFDRGGRHYFESRRHPQDDDRNVVVDQERGQFDNDEDEDRGRFRGWRGEKKRGWGRGRGRGPRRQWSPRRNNFEDRDAYDSRDRGYDKRERFSLSPVSTRGRGGFGGRGKGVILYEDERSSPPADDYYKYSQHDDRDVSPKSFRGRGRGTSFRPRGFRVSSRGFRGGRRGRGFRSSGRGRGFYRPDDMRSVEKDDRRSVEHASEREWKHDMYDSVQSDEEELPHSTTVNN